MSVLKGYFDDSGKASDPRCVVCGFSGYLGTAEQWKSFELAWSKVLKSFDVDYLHMKDMVHGTPPFERFKDGSLQASFLDALIAVIDECALAGIGDNVVIKDLDDFKGSTGINLDAAPFCISNNIARMCDVLVMGDSGDSIEAIYSHFDRAVTAFDHAFEYLKYDPLESRCNGLISLRRSEKEEWKTLYPLQAADLLAYECYRSSDSLTTWLQSNPEPRPSLEDYRIWKRLCLPKTEWHGTRRSGVALALASRLTSTLWRLRDIETLYRYRSAPGVIPFAG